MIAKAASALFLLATLLSVYNVYGDNSELIKQAETLACGATPCVRLLRAERTPLQQFFTFQTNLAPPRTRDISCARAFLLVGSFDCTAAQ